jgi:hypothetical protein
MGFFGQKDKRYNNYLDNYMSKCADLFKLGFIMLLYLCKLFPYI